MAVRIALKFDEHSTDIHKDTSTALSGVSMMKLRRGRNDPKMSADEREREGYMSGSPQEYVSKLQKL